MSLTQIYLALPVLNEHKNLESLVANLAKQSCDFKKLVVCVNNYDHWWEDPEKQDQCADNQLSLAHLDAVDAFDCEVIDKSSKGVGWPKKKGGVGWARKVAMDYIASEAKLHDIIVCIDADTDYPEDYLASIKSVFEKKPRAIGLAMPYYHRLAGDETDRLILRYEIYMRNYLLNMMSIENRYAFTALGSAMACPVWAYKKVGGLTPVKSGEDFYFLQKLIKNGVLENWAESIAYPSSRFSDRVIFGTGPALIKGSAWEWDSYPIYAAQSFIKVRESFSLFQELFEHEVKLPVSQFLKQHLGSENLLEPIRQNFPNRDRFIDACERKYDGLRILQFLRYDQKNIEQTNDEILVANLKTLFPENDKLGELLKEDILSFKNSSIAYLDRLRNFMFEKEMECRAQQASKGLK